MKKSVALKIYALLIIAAGIALDRLVKLWAVNTLKPVADIPVWNGVFHLTYATNTGGAWSIFSGKMTFFIIVTVIALLAGIYFLFVSKRFSGTLFSVALALIVSGAAGNFIDRVSMGYVVDMFYIKLINFPVFNVADLILTAGTVCLIWYVAFKYEGTGKKNERKQ